MDILLTENLLEFLNELIFKAVCITPTDSTNTITLVRYGEQMYKIAKIVKRNYAMSHIIVYKILAGKPK